MKKAYFLIVLLLCGLSVGNIFAAAAAAEGHLGQELREAAREGDEAKVKELIAAGADVDAAPDGYTALMYAANNGDTDIVRLLLDAGADVNVNRFEGSTPLMEAAGNGHFDTIELLLDNEADVNAQDDRGYTALMKAALKSPEDIVELLLSKGADKNLTNKDGKTAESLARYGFYKNEELANMIRDYTPSGRSIKPARLNK